MLKQDQAEKEIDKVRIGHWRDKRLKEVGKLPTPLARVGRGLLNHDPVNGKAFTNWQKRHEIMQKLPEELGNLKPAERIRLFRVLFPQIGEVIESAYQLCGRLPYEVDFDRRGFRAPSEETITRTSRWEFVERVVDELEAFDPTPTWLATWAAYLSEGSGADSVGILLAAAIDLGGPTSDEVFEILVGSINRTHAIGAMGRHVTRALLVAGKPEGWEAIEKLLLAAQRQEGLRQSILETVDEAHPEAFKRMLRLILDHDLLRFSATVRAAMVWFGVGEQQNESGSRFKKALANVLSYLGDPELCRQTIARGKDDELYFALWSAAYADAVQAVPLVVPLLQDKDVARRYQAVLFLDAVQLPSARRALVQALADADLRVALKAFEALRYADDCHELGLYEPLLQLLARMPAKATELKKIGPDDDEITADPKEIADELPDHLGDRNPEVLLEYLPRMSSSGRASVVGSLTEAKTLTEKARAALFALLGDRDSWVREQVLSGLKKVSVTPEEAVQVEGLLTRKSADLREQGLKLLAKQKGDAGLASADRLLASKNANQRIAGLELLHQFVRSKKNVSAARERAAAYLEKHPKPDEIERSQLDAILDVQREVPTLDNALGLLDRTQLSPVVAPQKRTVEFFTPAARAILTELERFIEKNSETMVKLDQGRDDDDDDDDDLDGDEMPEDGEDGDAAPVDPHQMPLGSITYQLPIPHWHEPRAKDLQRMPLREELTAWWQNRGPKLRDADGLELARARVLLSIEEFLLDYPGGNKKSPAFQKAMKAILGGVTKPMESEYRFADELLDWVARLAEPPAATDWLLDATETSFALVPDEVLTKKQKKDDYEDWRDWNLFEFWIDKLDDDYRVHQGTWSPEQKGRYFQLRRWLEKPTEHLTRRFMDWDLLTTGYELGLATLADLTASLLGPRDSHEDDYRSGDFDALEEATSLPAPDFLQQRPEVADLVDRCRQRILEVELARGDLPTAATEPAQALNGLLGLETLCRVLTALGPRALSRTSNSENRTGSLTRLVSVCAPAPDDTPEQFTARMRELIQQKAILPTTPMQLAFANPRWVDHVAHFANLPGLPAAVWWFFAHMQYATPELPEALAKRLEAQRAEGNDSVSAWDRLIAEQTTLSEEDRDEGAVDTDWFQRVFTAIGPKRWEELMEACKLADSSYKHAQKLADVLRGKAKRNDLIREVRQRKLKGSVRLLGLLPLATGNKRAADLEQRWKAINEYRKYARSLSPMSREDAIRTGEIGLANLARTAGYSDPNRLVWAMEWNEIQDLAAGPVVVTAEGVSVTLALDDQAQPVTTIQRGEKELKAIPPKVRKDKKVAALVERRTALRQQASRIRISLEAMMIRGDTILGEELPQLMKHPLVAKNLSRLVLIGEGIRGYPIAGGQALEDCHGKKEPVKKDEKLHLAHALDLLDGKDWHDWQAHCFRIERVQPFKQIFRELYLVTDAEKADKNFSRRYSGQQVNPRQAMAIFGNRSWRTKDGVEKVFPADNLIAQVHFQSGVGTPLEVEGLTLGNLQFRQRSTWQTVPLSEVPRRLFSEVMRDLDLVVSVAHVGGVDPEASASTIEMRAALAMELCSLLSLKNVKHKAPHLLIDGTLGKYSLHLGSGTVHKMPGGAVCIVSVPAQHRGRIFLPFADDDPRTAEVIAKLLMLARDEEIQDPGILDQLRR